MVSAAPAEHAGASSDLAKTGTELGGALGIALLGSLAAAISRLDMVKAPARARDTLSGAVHAVPPPSGTVLHSADAAFAHGVSIAALAAAGLLAVCAITSAVLLRQPTPVTTDAGSVHVYPATATA